MLRLAIILAALFAAHGRAADSPAEIYQKRIIPLLNSGDQSCSECHLQGIDLRSVLTDDPGKTFADLRARGWIDVDTPAKSKLLEFIARHSDSSTELQSRVRKAEFEAISAWIEAACDDASLLQQTIVRHQDLKIDEKLIHHARADQVTRRFTIAIWSQLERCANCHSPERNQSQVKEHGDQMSWIVPQDPGATLRLLVDRKLIDLDAPESSLLRTKPTGRVEHGAGTKFPSGGQTDSAWVDFLTDYANVLKGSYATAKDLPKTSAVRSWRSGLHLRITGIPESWHNKLVTITLHRVLSDGRIQTRPSATAECFVASGQTRWSNSLILLDQREVVPDEELTKGIEVQEALPRGKYELRLKESSAKESGDETRDLATAQIDAPWKSGHSTALVIEFDSLRIAGAVPSY